MARTSSERTPVIDLFAGPGGLGEGFAAVSRNGEHPFRVALSIEKEEKAHETLKLRSFFRRFAAGEAPEDYYRLLRGEITRDELFEAYPDEADRARAEARYAELGKTPQDQVDDWVREARGQSESWVLLGGPPCQAYSLAGRSRNKGNSSYCPEEDERHFLYQEYLHTIARHRPPVFVMENVKGLLSARVSDEKIVQQILDELATPGLQNGCNEDLEYRIYSLTTGRECEEDDFDPAELVVKAEEHGVPQARHRVILLGVRSDIQIVPERLEKRERVAASTVLDDLPRLRSGLSQRDDDPDQWVEAIRECAEAEWLAHTGKLIDEVPDLIREVLESIEPPARDRGGEFVPGQPRANGDELLKWLRDQRIGGVCNHSTRGHMVSDLHRYLYAACYAQENGRSPCIRHFPDELWPNHASADSGHFSDRFRVQLAHEPSTTVTSHISKDGHYYIHYDPLQCRSLTVREAARLQTFPDNYFFCGPRTSQYVQVGNAVPPYLAMQIGEIVIELLERWQCRTMDRISKERRSWNMSQIKSKDTEPEIAVRSVLHRMGYRFRLHRDDLPGTPDIVLPKYNTVVSVHGCYWHRHPGCQYAYTPKSRVEFWQAKFDENVERDNRDQEALEDLGWNVIVVWECETRDLDSLAQRLDAALSSVDTE